MGKNTPRDCGPGGQWMGFIFIWWGIVLEPLHVYMKMAFKILYSSCFSYLDKKQNSEHLCNENSLLQNNFRKL